MFVSGLYCSKRFQNIIPYYTRVYRKLTAVYKTGTGVKGTLGHVWGLWDLGTSSMGHVGQGRGTSNTGTQGYDWSLQKSEVNARFTVAHRDKHFTESKTLPRNKNTSRSPKYIPEYKNMSQDPKHFPERKNTSQNTKRVPESKIVLDSGMCFGFWEVFLNSRKCFGFWVVFWILGSIFEFWEVVCPYEPP